MFRLAVLSLLATMIVPVAAAECVGDVCVNNNTWGDGCTSGSEFDDAHRGVSVSAPGHYVYVSNYCYVYNFPGYSEEGSHLQAGYFGYDDFGFRAIIVSWYGYTWNGQESCSYAVAQFGFDPVPGGSPVEPIECIDGEPGLILP